MRIHLIDGTYELFRAHYSHRPPHQGPAGNDLKATLGVVSSLLTLLDDKREAVTHLAVAFDNPIESFRNELFAGYKTSAGMEPALLEQLDAVEEAVAALGVVVWSMKDFEADDALGTGAHLYKAHGQVRLLTPDKDLGQCLESDRVVQVDRMRQRVLTVETLREEKGIAPGSVADWLALVGDTADGIPGLEGWGEKGASLVLGTYPHLEDIPASAAEWSVKPRGADKLAATLQAQLPEAQLYRTLATVRTDAPLAEPVEALEWRGAPRERFTAWCDAVGSSSLKTRPRRWA
jgi:5'-3' exonuclease